MDYKALIRAWLDLLADFCRIVGLDKIADDIDAQLEKEEAAE